jgi:hypothetical protein
MRVLGRPYPGSGMTLPLGTAGTLLSRRRRRTGDHKIPDAEYTFDVMDDAKSGPSSPSAPLVSRCPVGR